MLLNAFFLGIRHAFHVEVLGPGLHIQGPASRVPGEASHVEGSRSRVPHKGPRSWVPPMGPGSGVPGEGSRILGPTYGSRVSLFQYAAFRPITLLKRDSNTGVSCKNCEIFKNAYLAEHLRKSASVLSRTSFSDFHGDIVFCIMTINV